MGDSARTLTDHDVRLAAGQGHLDNMLGMGKAVKLE
jgi:hypothetical protein